MTTSGLVDANLPAAKVEELGWDGKRVGWPRSPKRRARGSSPTA
ncbi:hypothetical protein [Lentzea atacamensis]|nr:hypothetical protein [Lentzea atacamensis]